MLPRRVIYYGKNEPLPDRSLLRAGPLSLVWENGDLRTIKLGDREVLRRIYVAIRDRNWGTVPPVLSNLMMDVHEASFRISFDVSNQQNEVDFFWQGAITGEMDGTITFTLDGVARSTFMRSRIGFCVLHPADAAGAACTVEHVDGTIEQAELPIYIRADQPVQPFADMAGLTHQVMPGVRAETRFSGDIFEMEDQRNWTDASFKTFSTPLRLPYPVEVSEGTRIVQSITLRIIDDRQSDDLIDIDNLETGNGISFAPLHGGQAQPLPALGLGMASHGQPLSERQQARLLALRPAHLRVDLRLADADCPARLAGAQQAAAALGAALEVALLLSDEPEIELAALRIMVQHQQPVVARWLIFPARELFWGGSATAQVVTAARSALADLAPGAIFASGTNADLIFAQRNMPPLDQIDALVYSINPQVHAFDNTSLVETLAAQGSSVLSARRLAAGRPVLISPVTLKMRWNAYASGPEPTTPHGELPPQVDPRQMSLFGAGWTLGSIKYLAERGAHSVTYYETTGWRGVMEREQGSPLPHKFRSIAGGVYPLYHVLADMGEFAGGEVLPSRSSNPLAVDGLILRKGNARRVLLANLTDESQLVQLHGLGTFVYLRNLSADNASQAMMDPETFRTQPGVLQRPNNGQLELTLSPYALARIDDSMHG
jgi:hypothetical protein